MLRPLFVGVVCVSVVRAVLISIGGPFFVLAEPMKTRKLFKSCSSSRRAWKWGGIESTDDGPGRGACLEGRTQRRRRRRRRGGAWSNLSPAFRHCLDGEPFPLGCACLEERPPTSPCHNEKNTRRTQRVSFFVFLWLWCSVRSRVCEKVGVPPCGCAATPAVLAVFTHREGASPASRWHATVPLRTLPITNEILYTWYEVRQKELVHELWCYAIPSD